MRRATIVAKSPQLVPEALETPGELTSRRPLKDPAVIIAIITVALAVLAGVSQLMAEVTAASGWNVASIVASVAGILLAATRFAVSAAAHGVVGRLTDDVLAALAVILCAAAGEPVGAVWLTAGYLVVRTFLLRRWDHVLVHFQRLADLESPGPDHTVVTRAQLERSRVVRRVDRWAERARRVAVMLAVVIVLWGFWIEHPTFWAPVASVVLLVLSPAAITAASWLPALTFMARAAEAEVLVRYQAAVTSLATIRNLGLDKTGALTSLEPTVVEVVGSERAVADRVLALAAAVEQHSVHPRGASIVTHFRQTSSALPSTAQPELWPATEVVEHPGRSIAGSVTTPEGSSVFVQISSPRWVRAGALGTEIDRLQHANYTVAVVSADQRPIGVIALTDTLREHVPETVAELHELGCQLTVLTADNQRAAQQLASAAGITDVRAQQRPEEKAVTIAALREHARTGMIAASVTDAPALRAAEVGLDVATDPIRPDPHAPVSEGIDIHLGPSNLRLVPTLIRMARAIHQRTLRNLTATIVGAALCLLGAVSGLVPLPVITVVYVAYSVWVSRRNPKITNWSQYSGTTRR